ncbi:MAG: hypothetical protein ACHQM6_04645 [Candidatus Kapaibacterium sp.]
MKYILIFLFLGFVMSESFAQFTDASYVAFYGISPLPDPLPMPMTPSPEPYFWMGAGSGVNFVHYRTASFFTPDNQPTAIAMQNGYGVAPFFAISFEFPMGNWYDNQNLFILEAFYDSKSASFYSESPKSNVPVKIAGSLQNGNISSSLDASLS